VGDVEEGEEGREVVVEWVGCDDREGRFGHGIVVLALVGLKGRGSLDIVSCTPADSSMFVSHAAILSCNKYGGVLEHCCVYITRDTLSIVSSCTGLYLRTVEHLRLDTHTCTPKLE
jgi:hypothetical protein